MPAGRPAIKTSKNGTLFAPSILSKLEDGFSMGMSIVEACLHADISEKTFHRVAEKNPELRQHFETLRNNPLKLARGIVHERLKRGTDVETAKWYLERKAKAEFSTRTESEENRNVTVNIVNFHDHNNSIQLQPIDTPVSVGDSEESSEVQVLDYPSESREDSSSDKQAEHRSTPESE